MVRLPQAKFSIGQIVRHRVLGYRGLICDVDPLYSSDPGWYECLERAGATKDQPWYHVLVDGTCHVTYVAEAHLDTCCDLDEAIDNPLLEDFFAPRRSGGYSPRLSLN